MKSQTHSISVSTKLAGDAWKAVLRKVLSDASTRAYGVGFGLELRASRECGHEHAAEEDVGVVGEARGDDPHALELCEHEAGCLVRGRHRGKQEHQKDGPDDLPAC